MIRNARQRPIRGRLIAATFVIQGFACGLPFQATAQVVPVGTEFQINTATISGQSSVGVASAPNGDFVVVWSDQGYDYPLYLGNIRGRRYASNGASLGSFNVTGLEVNGAQSPSIAADSLGDFMVVWQRFRADSLTDVFGRRFTSSGTALGSEFRVNTFTVDEQDSPNVALAANGDAVVVWRDDLPPRRVMGRRYASNGSSLGTEFALSPFSVFDHPLYPAVAANANGDFVTAWSQYGDGNNYGVFAQRFASNGSALGTEFIVNSHTDGQQFFPSIAIVPDGDFLIVWSSSAGVIPGNDQDGDLAGIFGQRFASSGARVGTEFQINTYTRDAQDFPRIETVGKGYLVVWSSISQDSYQSGVFARRYSRGGAPRGTEFQVNTYTPFNQTLPRLAGTSNGDFVVAWQSYKQDGQYYGVFGQRFSQTGFDGCPANPLSSCATPAKSFLLIKDVGSDGRGAKDKVVWKWLQGPATMQSDFGDPTTSAEYAFCIYAGSAQALVLEADVPPGGICDGGPCWTPISTKGYQRKDRTAATAGIAKLQLKGGDAGRAKILVKGRDANLDLDPLTLPLDETTDVIVQLSNSETANCWQTTLPPTSFKKNTDALFKAKSP